MSANDDLIQTLFSAVTHGDSRTLALVLADHVILHIPGRNRFAGDYFGKATVMQFWSTHADALTPITLHDVRATPEQVIADVSLYAHRVNVEGVFVCAGTCVFRVMQEQMAKWRLQLEDQDGFDAFWSSPAPTTAQAG